MDRNTIKKNNELKAPTAEKSLNIEIMTEKRKSTNVDKSVLFL